MDVTPWIFGTPDFDWDIRHDVSIWFGVGVILIAWVVDHRQRGGDFAFWLHIFGLITFWDGITLLESASETAKAVYLLINVGLLVLAVISMRRAYAVFGGLGTSYYLGHLAYHVFRNSVLFRKRSLIPTLHRPSAMV